MDEESKSNKLISPCKCDGSAKYIHKACLSKWRKTELRENQELSCPVCLTNYDTNIVYPFETIPIYNKNKVLTYLLYPPICIMTINSCFYVFQINLELPLDNENCIYYNLTNYICSNNDVEVYVLSNFIRPFIAIHDILAGIYLVYYLYYFMSVYDKVRYLRKGLPFLWIPILHSYLLYDVTGYYFIFSLLHHYVLPCYFIAHVKILRLMNDDL